MDNTGMIKRAYAEGAFIALCEAGLAKQAAADIAIKMAEDAENEGIGAGGGAGIGALTGAGLGAGGAALASILLKKNLLKSVPGLAKQLNPGAIKARLGAGSRLQRGAGHVLNFLRENPTAGAAMLAGGAGAGLGAGIGGVAGGLSD